MSIKVKKIIIVLILIVCFLIVSVAGVIVVTLGDSNYILNYINEDTYNKDVKTVKNIYVLFNINAALLNSTAGTYAILNQDDEFISDGSWYLY